MSPPARNPVFVPKAGVSSRGCPKCGGLKWNGRVVQGAVTFTCPCGNKWFGGQAQEPQDPNIPYPAESYEPTVKFVENVKMEGGVEEIRRKPDLRSDFRKGALVTNEDEE